MHLMLVYTNQMTERERLMPLYPRDDRERKVDATVPEVTDNCDVPSIGAHKSDNGDDKVDATVPKLAQQNVDDCDIPVISVHKSDNGESKTDTTVPEMAQCTEC